MNCSRYTWKHKYRICFLTQALAGDKLKRIYRHATIKTDIIDSQVCKDIALGKWVTRNPYKRTIFKWAKLLYKHKVA